MARAEFRNGPSLTGWVLGAVAGFIALCVAVVVGKFDLTPAAFIAAMVALAVGLILGMPWGASGVEPEVKAEAQDAAVAPAPSATFMPSAAAAPSASSASTEAQRPVGLSGPRGGVADDLKEIEGIGPVLEKLCHELGYYHFDQIAGWTEAEIAWLDQNLKGFRGRVTRDKWVAQARIIVTEGLDAFRVRAKTNDY